MGHVPPSQDLYQKDKGTGTLSQVSITRNELSIDLLSCYNNERKAATNLVGV
jgi:hypothetical protein